MMHIFMTSEQSHFRRLPDVVAFCLGLAIAASLGCPRGESPQPTTSDPEPSAAAKADEPSPETPTSEAGRTAPPLTTAREVLERMSAAYRQAKTYSDRGYLRLLAETGDQKIDQTSKFSVVLERPNKLQVYAYSAMLACDGKELRAAVESIPHQVLAVPAPAAFDDMKVMRIDPRLTGAMGDFAGPPPQLLLLTSSDPLKTLLHDAVDPKLIEPGEIEGRSCYRVRIRGPAGEGTLWIDRQTFVLRRVVFPTDDLRRDIGQGRPVEAISLVGEFVDAAFDKPIDPALFGFETPADAEVVDLLVPPHVAQLLGKKAPSLDFQGLDGKPLPPDATRNRVVVLDFWGTWIEACKAHLETVEKIREKFKDNSQVAWFAVNVDPPQAPNEEISKILDSWKVAMPSVRADAKTAAAFKVGEPPATFTPALFLIDAKGVVQHAEPIGNPRLAETLPSLVEKTLAGEDVFHEPLQEYEKQLEQLKQYARSLGEGVSMEAPIPETKILPRDEPTTMKLAPLWRCDGLKSPGNIAVVAGEKGAERLLVIENWKSVAEVGVDGRLIAVHQLKDLAAQEVVGAVRTAVGRDGRRYFAAFMVSQQRVHVFDSEWRPVMAYPEDALQNPHAGISDARLADLDGDGTLKLYVGYWGVVGVQAASLDGRRLWANRTDVASVSSLAVGGTGADGRRELLCTTERGIVAVLDASGRLRGDIAVPRRVLRFIHAADLLGDGRPLFCGLAAEQLGHDTAVGFSASGEELWSYTLPQGVHRPPIEPIIAGSLARDGAGQWLLPAADGSIHVISADGKPVDRFHYGAMLQGLATAEIDGRPALIVSSPDGLEAWRVE